MATERIAVRGSERLPVPNAAPIGAPSPGDIVEVTVMVKRRRPLPAAGSEVVSREEYSERFGADRAAVHHLIRFAGDFNLTIGPIDLTRRTIHLSGTVAKMNEAFGTQLRLFQSPQGVFRGRTGLLLVPAYLGDSIKGVFGLDERPQARARFRRHFQGFGPRAAGDTSYTPNQVSQLYNFPAGTGKGQTVAIVELGGGFSTSDLTAYFSQLGISPAPNVTAVSIDGATNVPVGDPNSADGEVLLDIEVIGGIASGVNIAVYFAPNTDQGFLDAITTAVHDSLRKPSVISISWGSAEDSWTAQALQNFDEAFQEAGLVGVSVCVASGDDGSNDGGTDGAAHVDFPASSPNVLSCGGTRLESSNGTVTTEVVWNHGPGSGASGGGVSEHFPLPSYQANANVPPSVNPSQFQGRGVPDVAGDADPATGYQIHVDGRDAVFGGTSAVAPLWAALIAILNEKTGKHAGFLNPTLYQGPSGAFQDIVIGDNGAYQAGPGWDACTGLGTPNGTALLNELRGNAEI